MKLASWSSHYAIREKRNLEKDLFPYFATRHIGDIEPIELLAAVRQVEERGALDVAHRVLTTAGQVWRYAVATGRAARDVSADIKGALKPHHGKYFAAITDPVKLGALIRVIRGSRVMCSSFVADGATSSSCCGGMGKACACLPNGWRRGASCGHRPTAARFH